jgi:hypothetical protein
VFHSVSFHPDLPVAGKGGKRNDYKVIKGNPQRGRPLAKPRPKGELNIKFNVINETNMLKGRGLDSSGSG